MHGYSVICCSSGQENKLVYPFMKTHLRFFLEKKKITQTFQNQWDKSEVNHQSNGQHTLSAHLVQLVD